MRLSKAAQIQAQQAVRELAEEKGVPTTDASVIAEVAQKHDIAPEELKELLGTTLPTSDDGPPASTTALAVQTAQALASGSPAGVAGVVGLRAAHAIGSKE